MQKLKTKIHSLKTLPARVIDYFVGNDVKQQLRLRRMLLALLGAFFLTAFAFYLWYRHLLRVDVWGFISLYSGLWLGNLIFLTLILSNINLKFKDPSLTIYQMIWGIGWVLVTVYLANQMRGILLMMVLLVYIFGGFRLTLAQLGSTVSFTILFYAVILLLLLINPHVVPPPDKEKEIVQFIMFCAITVSFWLITLELRGMRGHMQIKAGVLKEALFRAEESSMTDLMTGSRNRRFIISVLNNQRAMAGRQDHYMFSVFMLDLDHFKNVNDTYGHSVGDAVLTRFSKGIQDTLRKVDYFGRMGGEEFLVVAPFTNIEQIKIAGLRICKAAQDIDYEDIVPDLKITVSVGATEYRWPESIDETLRRADQALYLAKETGRNQLKIL